MERCTQTDGVKVLKLTSKALSASLSIQMIAWSDVALHDKTMCSNRPSTGMAVLTSGGYLPHLCVSNNGGHGFRADTKLLRKHITTTFLRKKKKENPVQEHVNSTA